jgi:hypothetical protein
MLLRGMMTTLKISRRSGRERRMQGCYILSGKQIVPCDDLEEWQGWKDTHDRIVGCIHIAGIRVVTSFDSVGLVTNADRGAPRVFCTRIIDTKCHPYRYPVRFGRYTTWEEAEAGHERALEMVKTRSWSSGQYFVRLLTLQAFQQARLARFSPCTTTPETDKSVVCGSGLGTTQK